MAKKKLQDLQFTELYLVKADWNRTYMAQITREKSADGKDIIRGNVVIDEGMVWSMAETEEELGEYLDDICVLKLDHNLHSTAGVIIQILGIDFFLN